jgi:uncharacterized protein (DUF1684 family)
LSSDPIARYLSLLDWRRRTAEMYAEIRLRHDRDPVSAHEFWRRRRDDLFRNHPQSPLLPDDRARVSGLKYFEYDARLSFTATLRQLPEKRDDVVTSDRRTMRVVRVGAVDLPVGVLEVMWLDEYSGGVFLPFRDATSGSTTSGVGRYLIDTAKGADLGGRRDELVVDFNFSYNPSCAYDEQWSCPLAPAANSLPVAVEAGERV